MYCNIERAQRLKRRRYRFNGLRLIRTLIFLGVIIFAITFSGNCIIKKIHRDEIQGNPPPSVENLETQRESEKQTNKVDKDPQEDLAENPPENVGPKAETSNPPSDNNNSTVESQQERKDNKKQHPPSQKHYDEFFPDTVFVGDSITEGISFFLILDDSKVVSEKGCTVLKAKKEIDRIVNTEPKNLFVQLGLNDMLYDMSSEKFAADYSELIQNLKTRLPEVNIYVQSIFPVSEELEKKRPELSNAKIDEFNSALKKMTEDAKVHFIDVALILKDVNGNMSPEYTSDGIHLKYKSYILWFDHLKDTIALKAVSEEEIEEQ